VSIAGFILAAVIGIPIACVHLYGVRLDRRSINVSDMILFIWVAALPIVGLVLFPTNLPGKDDEVSYLWLLRVAAFGAVAFGSLLLVVRAVWHSNEPVLWIGLGSVLLGVVLLVMNAPTVVLVPMFWFVFYAGAYKGKHASIRRRPPGTCPHCGYSRRGLPSQRCPECGRFAALG
jgi:hypothetical protein